MIPLFDVMRDKLSSPAMAERLERLGTALLPLAARLPSRPGSVLIATGLNVALAQGDASELEPLYGKVVAIRVTDSDLVFHFSVSERGFCACGAQVPAVVISAAGADFVRLALRRVDADTLFFSRRLTMEGDTELGLLLKNRLDALEFSWQPGVLPHPLALVQALQQAATGRPAQKRPDKPVLS
jgi:predicted lipid carrier protein YhbT